GARLVETGFARDTHEMPHAIFDVVRIHRLMQFKLFTALHIFSAVIKGDAALPMIRFLARLQLDVAIKILDRTVDLIELKFLPSALVISGGSFGIDFDDLRIIFYRLLTFVLNGENLGAMEIRVESLRVQFDRVINGLPGGAQHSL